MNPTQNTATLENVFTGGLKTEFTGLNFPEHAATDTDNCIYTVLGNVTRRAGFDYETNHTTFPIGRTDLAMSSFIWNNVGGNGNKRVYVFQSGGQLIFYDVGTAAIPTPLSTRKFTSNVLLGDFQVTGAASPNAVECQYAEGNGYLFVFHPNLDPFYITYDPSVDTFTGHRVDIKIRDFHGIIEPGVSDQLRPTSSSVSHTYNLLNQGWTSTPLWVATSTSSVAAIGTGSRVFTVASGLPITPGLNVSVNSTGIYANPYPVVLGGTVTSYSGTTLTINATYVSGNGFFSASEWSIVPTSAGRISDWQLSQANYPSNSDVWWRFKDTSEVFNPTVTAPNVTLNAGPATKGFFILSAFNQDRGSVTGIVGLPITSTVARPKTGAFFQGRVWYAGIEAPHVDLGSGVSYSWTESIYFSQIIENVTQFGKCYQSNDPTSEEFADELPSDGGVIVIQGAGSIHKLIPVQNGLLVFASNGIWYLTGSQGIGFTANDYTSVPISSIRSVSSTSYVNVNGYPIFWNEEGIYSVQPSKDGGLDVQNLCYGTILSFYSQIPSMSKKYARGDYNPISFVLSWVYNSEDRGTIASRYDFNKVLNFNTANKSFYPYTLNSSITKLHDVKYVVPPTSGTSYPDPKFKFITTTAGQGSWVLTFSEELDTTNWVDYFSIDSIGVDYDSYFVTGYKLAGKALTKFQPTYVYMFSNADVATSYKIQGIWDYANSPNSGRYSTMQLCTNALTRFGVMYRKHRIRGRGLSLQLKVTSVSGLPFDIIGWSSIETPNSGM